jgi:hypothetical protein
MREPITFELDQPLSFPGQETITTFTVHPYTGKDLLECGLPFNQKSNSKGDRTEAVDMASVRLLLARMAKVPPTMIDQMAAVDMFQAIEALRAFFFYRTPKSSSTDTSKPADGPATAALSSV